MVAVTRFEGDQRDRFASEQEFSGPIQANFSEKSMWWHAVLLPE